MSFPRYPAYKATGMDWLGEVPDHWSVNRLKLSVDSCTNGVWGDEAKSDENDVLCIRVADFDRQSLTASKPDEPTIRNVSDRDIEQRSLRNGDLLIEKSGGGEKQPVGAVVLYTGTAPAVCSNFVARMRLKRGQVPSFWKYVHHAAYSVRLNTKSIKQTSGIQNLDQQQYLDEIAAYPPLEEQLSIASFLDHETAKIDALINEQERMIELLQEKRQVVISDAVTKGLNQNAPMRDSGVEWLGKVPEHWLVQKLGYSCFMQEGPGLRSWQFTSEGTRVICVTNITPEGISFSEFEKYISTQEFWESYKRFKVDKGDIIISSSGNSWGKLAVFYGSEEVMLNTSTIRVRGLKSEDLNTTFLLYLLESIGTREQLSVAMTGSCQPNFGPSHLARVKACLPPVFEQEQICEFLDTETHRIKTLQSYASKTIELLRGRRKTVISAAVTGQIDVRGLAPQEDAA